MKKVQPCNPCVRAAFKGCLYFLHFFPCVFYISFSFFIKKHRKIVQEVHWNHVTQCLCRLEGLHFFCTSCTFCTFIKKYSLCFSRQVFCKKFTKVHRSTPVPKKVHLLKSGFRSGFRGTRWTLVNFFSQFFYILVTKLYKKHRKKVHQSTLKRSDLASVLAFGQVYFLFLSAQKCTIVHASCWHIYWYQYITFLGDYDGNSGNERKAKYNSKN